MRSTALIVLGIVLVLGFLSRRGIHRFLAMRAVLAASRAGDYATALTKAEGLTDGTAPTAAYLFMRGALLHHLGKLDEAEASLRKGLPLETDPRRTALSYNTLGYVLMDQERYPESIAAFEAAGRAWPERGANQRGIAQVWLRQGREHGVALRHARRAVEIDRGATGMPQRALDDRLAEDLAMLAWAVAVDSGDVGEVETLLAESFRLCSATDTKETLAECHHHAGRAYAALTMPEKSREHFRRVLEVDPHGAHARRVRALLF